MPDVLTQYSTTNLSYDLQTYLDKKLLEVAKFRLTLDQFAVKKQLPKGGSKVIQFNRYDKFTSPSGTPGQLTEGVAPDSEALAFSKVSATAEQYGKVVKITDIAELTVKHDIVQQALEVLGIHAAELYDHLIFNVLAAGTSIVYADGGSNINTLTVANSQITYDHLLNIVANLDDAGAPQLGDGYVFVVPPQVKAQIQDDADFKTANAYLRGEAMWKGEIGHLGGMRIVCSNGPAFTPTAQTVTGKINKVYTSFAIGKSSYAVTDLQSLEVINTPPGGLTDPLKQVRALGYKFSMKAAILNQSWISVFKSAGRNSVNNP